MKQLALAALMMTITGGYVSAQYRGRPAPTGQVQRASTGGSSNPYSNHQPRPTGQIAPAAQPGAALPGSTPASGVINPNINGGNPAAGSVTQPGQVPKASTNYDPSVSPDRYYQPATTTQQTVTVETQNIPRQNVPQNQDGYQNVPTNQGVIVDPNQVNPAAQPVERGTYQSEQPAAQPQSTNSTRGTQSAPATSGSQRGRVPAQAQPATAPSSRPAGQP